MTLPNTEAIGIIRGIKSIGRTKDQGIHCPIATPFTKARSAKFSVSVSGAPATTSVASIAANRR
jgi:hypothetical protein